MPVPAMGRLRPLFARPVRWAKRRRAYPAHRRLPERKTQRERARQRTGRGSEASVSSLAGTHAVWVANRSLPYRQKERSSQTSAQVQRGFARRTRAVSVGTHTGQSRIPFAETPSMYDVISRRDIDELEDLLDDGIWTVDDDDVCVHQGVNVAAHIEHADMVEGLVFARPRRIEADVERVYLPMPSRCCGRTDRRSESGSCSRRGPRPNSVRTSCPHCASRLRSDGRLRGR